MQGEVPLLMSRGALSKLGMVYDLEGHSAQFKHLGIERFSLINDPRRASEKHYGKGHSVQVHFLLSVSRQLPLF